MLYIYTRNLTSLPQDLTMRLVNRTFDPNDINDSIFTKKGNVRRYRKREYWHRSTDMTIDLEAVEASQEELFGDVYRPERDYQPRKQSMRTRWSRGKKAMIEWYGDLGHGRYELSGQIYGYIEKRIGRPFAEVFSAFCKDPRFKPSKVLCTSTPQYIFLDNFVNPKRKLTEPAVARYHRHSAGDFIIDGSGLIQYSANRRVFKPSGHISIPEKFWTYTRRFDTGRFNMVHLSAIMQPHELDIFRKNPDANIEWFEQRLRFNWTRFKEANDFFFKEHFRGWWGWEMFMSWICPKTYTRTSLKAEPGTKDYENALAYARKLRKRAKKKISNADYWDFSLYVQNCKARNHNLPALQTIMAAGSIRKAIEDAYEYSLEKSEGWTFDEYVTLKGFEKYV